MTTTLAFNHAFSTGSNDPISMKQLWTGRILSGTIALLLTLDGVMKLFKPAPVIEATLRLGYPESSIVGIGLALLGCVALYLVPRTAALGAVFITGYLGGAVATHVRVGGGWFEILFPIVIAALVWGGLWLRDHRLQRELPLIKTN